MWRQHPGLGHKKKSKGNLWRAFYIPDVHATNIECANVKISED